MANIVSSNGTDKLTVDPTSKAARATLFDSDGNEIHSPPTGSYLVSAYERNVTTDTANNHIMLIQNGFSKKMHIRRIWGFIAFDGTAVAAATRRFNITRFRDWDRLIAFSGGTVLTTIKKRTSYASSGIVEARFTTGGLSLGASIEDGPIAEMAIPISITGAQEQFNFQFSSPNSKQSALVIDYDQVFSVRYTGGNKTAGQSLAITVEWDER